MAVPTVGKIKDSVPLSRQRCVEVAAPYKMHDNKSPQISQMDNIRPYCTTLGEAK